ncbi:hypothetical protein N0V94_001645 [Neodidymelliopsis sp. IMI 364377]|nr:hypothetical protein N0V94_001645 [Neodidymelliopsis sp. IMI 364377]
MPDVTVASFDFHIPPPNHLSPAPFNPTFIDPTFTVFTSQMTSSSPASKNPTLSLSAIVGITLGLIAFLGILIGLALFFYRRRKPKPSPSDTEKAEPEETLAEKMERMREFRRRRNTANTAGKHKAAYEAAKRKLRDKAERARGGEPRRGENKEVFVVGDGEEEHKENEKKAKEQEEAVQRQEMEEEAERRWARRPSGLRMHPPSASSVVTVVEAGATPTRV